MSILDTKGGITRLVLASAVTFGGWAMSHYTGIKFEPFAVFSASALALFFFKGI